MQKHFYNNKKIGILGGGQLGRMLLQAGIDLNIDISVLDPDKNAPCKSFCLHFVHGSFKDYNTVLNFGRQLDTITIEIEHVNVDALQTLESMGKEVSPSAEIIRIVQDKGLQKQFYKEHNIPTSDFILLESKDEIKDHLSFLPAFQKLRTSGYDGRGVQGIHSEADLSKALDGKCVLEKRVPYEKEISVIVARGKNGETICFPAVDMVLHQEKNVLSYLVSPAEISEHVAHLAERIAKEVAAKLNLVGILAVEMFLLENGEILVNEIAPRPHNSGHQTIEGNITSQYAQLWRAILGLPLGDTQTIQATAMINLLGAEGYEGEVFYEGIEEAMAISGVYVHLYGKEITKPFRKMGHITVTGSSLAEVHEKARTIEALVQVKSL